MESEPHGCTLTDREAFYADLHAQAAKRCPDFSPLEGQVMLNLAFTFGLAETILSTRVQRVGMTLPGLNCLAILNQRGEEGAPLSEIGHLLVTTRANITGLVDHLAKKGFVRREDHPKDRRIILARITPAGKSFIEGYLPAHLRTLAAMSHDLSIAEKKQLVQLLTKLRRGVEVRKEALLQ
jgi:DNA-binding MarR family transcriptional regulator